jgi:Trk K+ transport system NAD-binding subunit
MMDLSGNVLKTFSDYSEDPDLQFSLVELMPGSSWHGKSLAELRLPSGMATALILRGKEKLIPHGETILQELDRLVMTSQPWHSGKKLLDSETLKPDDDRIGQSLATIRSRSLVCIARDRRMIVPEGSIILQPQDTLVFVDSGSLR